MTVSRALNNPELVRPETIERVKKAVELTGYIPNMLAGSLASRRTHLIAAVVPQLYNPMFVDMVQGLEDELAAHGYQLLLSLSGYSQKKEEDSLTAILSRQPDGIVLTGIHHEQGVRKRLITAGVPVVETWDLTPTPIDMLVGFSHFKIGETIARYLLNKGCKHFGLVWGDDRRAEERRKGLESVLYANGIEKTVTHLVPIPATFELGRQGMQGLLDSGQPLDAIVCSSDVLAQGVLTEAGERGIAVPRDMAVIGFGDLNFAAHTSPAISTVHVDKRKIGIMAARALLARLEGKPFDNNVCDVGFTLIERTSTTGTY